MILLIGGTGQGKLAYAIEKTGCGPEDVARDPEAARRKPIFVGLESWIREHPDEILESGAGERQWDACAVCWPGGRTGWSASSAD